MHSSHKKVIFVGGTSYSGSTLIDLMLAHGPGGFSCGEVSAVFRPYRKRHIRYQPHAAPAIHIPWERLLAAGPDNLYATIFNNDPAIERIIDSSKDPQWISARTASLKAQGITTRQVLIWKTPAEFLQSRSKRGRQDNWERAWINYHRHYFQQVRGFASLSYRKLVTEPQALATLCEYLAIPYFPGKHEYWRGHYQTLFGNRSAKIHLSDSHSRENNDSGNALLASNDMPPAPHPPEKHREIYYEAASANVSEALTSPRCSPYLTFLEVAEDCLMSRIAGAPEPPPELKANQVSIMLKSMKRTTLSAIVRAVTIGK